MGIKFGLQALLWMYMYAVQQSSQEDVLNEHLLVLSTDASGMAVVFVAGRHGSYDHANYLFTSGERVSSACTGSERSSRCRILLVLSSGQTRILLAPLQDAVGLMEFRYDGRELLKVRDFTLSITAEFLIDNCVPLDIVRFEGRLIVLCLENLRTLRSCDILVNRTDISQSVLKHCYLVHNFASSLTEADYQYISNFVSYPSIQTELVFVVRGGIYGIRYDSFNAHFFSSLNDVSCDRLQYAGDDIFYVYCTSGQAFVYNTDSLRAERAGLIPFRCLQSGETLFKVQQTDQGTIIRYDDRINYRTAGLNFTTGVCYDRDTFFLLDRIEGMKVFHQNTGSFHTISSSFRDKYLFVFNGPYLMVYRSNPTEIVLYNSSFQSVVDLSPETAVAMGIIPDLRVPLPATSPAPTTPPTKMPPRNDVWYTGESSIAVWVVLAVLAVLAVITVPLTVFIVRYLCRSKRGRNYDVGTGLPMCDQGGRDTPVGQDGSHHEGSKHGSHGSESDDLSVAGTRDSLIDGRSGDEDDDDDNLVQPTSETQDHATNTDLVLQQ